MVLVDPTFAEGETSEWCVTDEIFEIGMNWNGKLNPAWGVEMKMWPIDEVIPVVAAEATKVGPKKPAKMAGSGPGGEWADSAGNSVKWGDDGITIGNAGNGKIIISGDEINLKMSATSIAATTLGAVTVMASLF